MFQSVRPRQTRKLLCLGALSLALTACGSDEGDPASPMRTGVFLDSAVEGLSYATATMSGKTNAAGEFSFNAGESITFSIGGFALPTVQAANIVTPMDIFGSTSVTDARVADLSRLLQSMDSDGDVNNGISFPLTVESVTSDTQLDFGEAGFDAQAEVVIAQVNGEQVALVDTQTATAHLNQTLVDNQLITDGCTSDHPFVGRTVELSTRAHSVSGTVTVLNDCEIEVTNFNYDGGGPSVYFYAAQDRDYAGESFIIGQQLNGQQWANDRLRLPIPEGMTLDDFNSLSVWCIDFRANFGDAFFGDS